MSQHATILVPDSELPAEGAEPVSLPEGQAPATSDLLAAYSDLLSESSLTFEISADGAVVASESPDTEDLLELSISGAAGGEASIELTDESPRASVDLAEVAQSVTAAFDAGDARRQLVANLASSLRSALGDSNGSPVPLIRWYQTSDEDEAGVAQLLGIWLANDEHLEALRESGNEGIIFDEAEIEGRGLRETLTAFTILGVMVGGTLTADAGLFSRTAAKEKPAITKVVANEKQAPAIFNQEVLAKTDPASTTVIVDVSKQRAYLMSDGKIVLDTPISTARKGKYTPRGEFKITQRVATGKRSTIYGCALPYWMRLNQTAIGMHVGDLPGYPASAGCIRLPKEVAPIIFENTKSGTVVKVVSSWTPDVTVASK